MAVYVLQYIDMSSIVMAAIKALYGYTQEMQEIRGRATTERNAQLCGTVRVDDPSEQTNSHAT